MIHNPSLMHTKIVLPISKTCMTIAAAKPPGLIITSLISPHPTLTAIAFWYLVIMIGHPQYSLYTTLLMLLHVIKSLWSHQSVLMMGRSLELSPVLNTFLRNQTTFMMRLWCIHQFWPDTHSCSVMKFQAGTYQTRSFAELTPKFQTCGTQSHKFQAPSPTPNNWDPRATYHFYSGLCHVVIDQVWLALLPAMVCNLIDTKEWNKKPWVSPPILQQLQQGQQLPSQQELWQFCKSSRDNHWLAIPSPSDLRHKKCHIYH
jgi:hypothetical protein